ncbi:MAG: 3-phosphoshikimate 1-carboxyvinyltransferase [Chitinispirillales bacterium]|jgi:3-phosphoshikimate 1-carboxyvinyltransferase|nr:3-phosphoshikimate 1-carboxyvinyltransferase [Chitinispirillales bacterium]
MKWIVRPSKLSGAIAVPPSKSHTIRALIVAALASGDSAIRRPLLEGDGASAIRAAVSLGATVDMRDGDIFVRGVGGDMSLGTDHIDMGNSGTGLNLFCSAAALGGRRRRFDGDASLRARPVRPLLDALAQLGASVSIESAQGQDLPFAISGPLKGGRATVDGISSQFVSSLLFAAPLIHSDTHITVQNLHEQPYVEMTLWWLAGQGIEVECSKELTTYKIRGGQGYKPFDAVIPGDFSSAAFSAVAAAIGGSPVMLRGLDFSDTQGDKEIFCHLEAMGAKVERGQSEVTVYGGNLHGAIIDLNSTPDALPALAVAAASAQGETVFTNVEQARIKETDRIAVMAQELGKMGIEVKELPDGMVVRGGRLRAALVESHHDHRVAMALAVAGMNADGETVIEGAEAAGITYGPFVEDFSRLGANIAVDFDVDAKKSKSFF